MPDAINSIQTRQLTEDLAHTSQPLAANGSFVARIVKVAGYDAVEILGIADQAFTVQIEEACKVSGPFVVTRLFASAVSGSGQAACGRVQPCGSFMRISVWNGPAPQRALSFCALGIPLP